MGVKKWFVWAALSAFCLLSQAQINLLPKYGDQPKNPAQLAADANFIALIDKTFDGNRKKASEELVSRGWAFYRAGKPDDAIRRFNQAWLVQPDNGYALWGMGVIEMGRQRLDSGLALFQESAVLLGDDIDFQSDFARTKAMMANSEADLQLIWKEFERIHVKAPDHTLNLQNWAISYFYAGRYRDAWQKIQLAERTPRGRELDPNFLQDLSEKMPRP
jgi:tetratricopeptide (TPR) repeat protein